MSAFVRVGTLSDETVEVVERKGVGHPDSICDALADELCRALCRHYLRTFGAIYHHNVDKALLVGGRARAEFGGGQVLDPIEIDLAGRATRSVGGVDVPLMDLAEECTSRWFEENMHAIKPQHWRLALRVRGGSDDLVGLFSREASMPLANDTSIGVGHAPHSPVERAVLAADARLRSLVTEAPEVGEDTKVLAVRDNDALELVVACALVGQWLADAAAYDAAKARVAAEVRAAAAREWDGPLTVTVNAADDASRGQRFLTVTGTSAESGDDGEVGRGNRQGGLITPYRPMTMEAFAGKNPVSHVGKTYSVIAQRIAGELARRTNAARVECVLVSRIGQPVDRPAIAHVRFGGVEPREVRAVAEDVVGEQLARAGTVWRDLLGWTA